MLATLTRSSTFSGRSILEAKGTARAAQKKTPTQKPQRFWIRFLAALIKGLAMPSA